MNSSSLVELQERVEQFTPQQKRLLKERLQQIGVAMPSRGGRLVGFYQTSSAVDEEELRSLCASRLPTHMVPQRFIEQQLALTPTGKLDRNAMRLHLWSASSHVVSDQDMTAARNDVEATLVEIWSDVLGIDEISVFDNFFEVGGDSLQVIRILSRASKAGLAIKPDAIFAHPTIAELAQLAGANDQQGKASVVAYGTAPLLPIQSWFFDVFETHRNHWNHSYLFSLKHVSPDAVRNAVGQLLSLHAGLRSQFSCQGETWTCTIAESMEPVVVEHKLESRGEAGQLAEMTPITDAHNANLSLADSPLLKVLHFRNDAGDDYLNLIAHHLVVDAVSWQVIVNDLQQLLGGQRSQSMTEKTSPLKQWAEALQKLAGDQSLQRSADYWLEHARQANVSLPLEGEEGGSNLEGHCQKVTRLLDERLTEKLRTEAPKELRASVQEMLISGLVRTLTNWTQSPNLTLDLEGHGRETLFDDVDISQTVGWFTTVFPINFMGGTEKIWTSPIDSLRGVKDQLRAIPDKGLSHGLFKYLAAGTEVQRALRDESRSNVLFNYLGVEEGQQDSGAMLSLVQNRFGVTRHPDAERAYQLELNAVIRDNCLSIDWTFGPGLHSQERIEQLADNMMANITDLLEGTDRGEAVSPTDFPMAGLDQSALDNLSSQLDGLDDE
ncbi:MAG: condensation domain-containing protein [Gammaproteobacteria bacterium]